MRPASPVRRNRKRRALRTTQPLTRLAVLPSCCTKKAGAMDSRKSYLTAQTGSGSELGRCGFAVQFYASLDTGTSISWSSKGRNVRPSRQNIDRTEIGDDKHQDRRDARRNARATTRISASRRQKHFDYWEVEVGATIIARAGIIRVPPERKCNRLCSSWDRHFLYRNLSVQFIARDVLTRKLRYDSMASRRVPPRNWRPTRSESATSSPD